MPKGKRKQRTDDNFEIAIPNEVESYTPKESIAPARTEQRICFGIMWFTSPKDAAIAHDAVRRQGRMVNGGFFDGMACGRAPEWDYEEDGVQYFAVTN
jgi:hypothetical protein